MSQLVKKTKLNHHYYFVFSVQFRKLPSQNVFFFGVRTQNLKNSEVWPIKDFEFDTLCILIYVILSPFLKFSIAGIYDILNYSANDHYRTADFSSLT